MVCPQQRGREDGEVLNGVGVRALAALDAVELKTGELAGFDGCFAVGGGVMAAVRRREVRSVWFGHGGREGREALVVVGGGIVR